MNKPLIYLVAGARPNFMKLAPIVRALQAQDDLEFSLIHTGQHADRQMSGVFFEELGMPAPDHFLCVGNAGHAGHARQTADVMVAFETLCLERRPDMVVVVGDVNSTLACALAARKLGIRVAHVEAGLRSGDLGMPEEINRIATDSLSDLHFASESAAVENLRRAGVPERSIVHVGQVMVDNLLYQLELLSDDHVRRLESHPVKSRALREAGRYAVVTLHRPSNVDQHESFAEIARALRELSMHLPLIFPLHPRTRKNLERFGIELGPRVTLMGPQSYMSFLNLWKDAALVLTDSGGLQEETTALGVHCLTLRDNTERPVTLSEGSNVLAGTRARDIVELGLRSLARPKGSARCPALWDGRSAERIVAALGRTLLERAPLTHSAANNLLPVREQPEQAGQAELSPLTQFVLRGLRNSFMPEQQCWSHIYHLDGRAQPNQSIPASDAFYSLNVVLGLARAGNRAWEADYDLAHILRHNAARLFEMPGPDYAKGMALWAAAQAGVELPGMLAGRLRAFVSDRSRWSHLRAQDAGMLLSGMCAQKEAGNDEYDDQARELFKLIRQGFLGNSGLFYDQLSGLRRNFSSFATQTYLISACYHYAERHGDHEALDMATRATAIMIGHQGPQGEWPWFYFTPRACVVDPYEVYSVHQDGMAPMFLFMGARHGVPGAHAAIDKGFRWILGDNQLQLSMLEPETGMIWRSILRAGELTDKRKRMVRALGNAALGRTAPYVAPEQLVRRAECRSYHLGWVLYSFGQCRDMMPLTHHAQFVQANALADAAAGQIPVLRASAG